MEKLLVFHLDEPYHYQLKQLSAALKIRCEFISDTQFNQPIEALVAGKPLLTIPPHQGAVPSESLILMCDFDDKKIDKLLLSLRKHQLNIDYKAILTPTNQKWNVLRLLLEMQAERKAYEVANSPKNNA